MQTFNFLLSFRRLTSRLAVIFACLALTTALVRASYPKVKNFESRIFGGGTQTWDIALDSAGCVYFANKYGLIRYDSRRATPYALANESEVRSILFDRPSGRIYAGGSEEFGYFSHDPASHTLRYTSLSAKLPPARRNFNEVWNILQLDKEIWFQEDHSLFRFDGKILKVFPFTHKITASGIVDGILYIGSTDGHLAAAGKTDLLPIQVPELDGKRIVAILPYSRAKGPLIITEFDGIYHLNDGKITKLNTPIDAFMKENQVFCAAAFGPVLAIGTVNDGAAIMDLNTGELSFANRLTGMQNNTVLTMRFDASGNLWAGLDNGVDLISYNSPIRNLLGIATTNGAGYVSKRAGDIMYLGTNQGLYFSPFPLTSGPVPPVPTRILHGQVWDIAEVNGRLMACTDGGLYTLSGPSASKVEGCPGTFSVNALDDNPDYALASTYENFFLLHYENGAWRTVGKVAGYTGAGGAPLQDDNGNFWLSHWMKGIYRLRLNIDKRRFDVVELYDSKKGLPSDKGNAVTKYANNVVFPTERGYYIYDPVSDTMKPHPTLDNLFKGIEGGTLATSPAKEVWNLGNGKGISIALPLQSGGYRIDSVSFAPLSGKTIPGYEHYEFLGSSVAVVGGEDGFYELNPRRAQAKAKSHQLIVSRITATGDSIIHEIGDKGDITVPYGLNSLNFEMVVPEYRADNTITYSFKLEGYDDEWSPPSATGSKEYTRLHEGDYQLRVRARNSYDRSFQEKTVNFKVLPPWYRTIWARLVYVVLIITGVYYIWHLMQKWTKRKADAAARTKEVQMRDIAQRAEADAMQKEIQISELKGEQLVQQVKHKSAELSNAMLNLARKNEILLSISDSLEKLHKSLPDSAESHAARTEIKKIKSNISENISHDDDWRRFTHNFDAVYEGFTKRLQELHPNMTRTELKVCCYLRMGLSSKDIAPLFSISYRSVEMTRYRLRKKLGLKREENLVSYLESI